MKKAVGFIIIGSVVLGMALTGCANRTNTKGDESVNKEVEVMANESEQTPSMLTEKILNGGKARVEAKVDGTEDSVKSESVSISEKEKSNVIKEIKTEKVLKNAGEQVNQGIAKENSKKEETVTKNSGIPSDIDRNKTTGTAEEQNKTKVVTISGDNQIKKDTEGKDQMIQNDNTLSITNSKGSTDIKADIGSETQSMTIAESESDAHSFGQTEDGLPKLVQNENGEWVPNPEAIARMDAEWKAYCEEENKRLEEEYRNSTDNYTVDSHSNQQMLDEINAYRVENGLNPLTWSDELSEIANIRAKEQSDLVYNQHKDISHGYGTETEAGENLSSRAEENVLNGWKNSEGHNRFLLDPDITEAAVGSGEYTDYDGYTYDGVTTFLAQ